MEQPKNITLKKTSPVSYEIYFANNKLLGSCTQDIDGFFYFWAYGNLAWNDYSLRLVADTLQFLNRDIENKLKQELNKK